MENSVEKFKLRNGYEIPCIGFGTWDIRNEELVVRAIKKALDIGYRHIDTASAYQNEKSIGRAIAEYPIDREELFITSKVWATERGYEKTLLSFEKTLKDLALDYIDLYLIHWAASPNKLNNEILLSMAKKYDKSPAQICLRWCLQNEVIALPKSITPSRIKENFEIFDFEISQNDMTTINGMPSFAWSGIDPDEVDF